MTPGPYEIPPNMQSDMSMVAVSLKQSADRPRFPLTPEQRHAMHAIVDKIEFLTNFDFLSENSMVLMKPDFTFGYVRMGVDQILQEPPTSTPPPVFDAAVRVRDWLDSIGHRYPQR